MKVDLIEEILEKEKYCIYFILYIVYCILSILHIVYCRLYIVYVYL